jgi:hypothetical protein
MALIQIRVSRRPTFYDTYDQLRYPLHSLPSPSCNTHTKASHVRGRCVSADFEPVREVTSGSRRVSTDVESDSLALPFSFFAVAGSFDAAFDDATCYSAVLFSRSLGTLWITFSHLNNKNNNYKTYMLKNKHC